MRTSTMRLAKLPANQCWAFVLGDSLISMDGQTLFPTRTEAVEAAKRCRLEVTPQGRLI